MAGTKEIKRRIKSVKSTKKITKAMELVAASKMKKAVSKAVASRAYANYSWDLLSGVSENIQDLKHPFFTENKKTDKVLYVIVTSNRGLCGGYNSQVLKRAITAFKKVDDKSQIDILVIGKKGDNSMRRLGMKVAASFTELPDIIDLSDITPISTLITSEYKLGNYKEVFAVYTEYISALSQRPKRKKLLPVSRFELKESIESVGDAKSKEILSLKIKKNQYIFEGDMNSLVESLAEKLIRMQIYQTLLESNASEQSSRMIAMKNAGDAASEMIDDLTLVFNKARQANITREISEISAGMASVS
ncbi:MAG: ATP synthase F1 subunit gamma [Candidatus Paceibacterota bacterium]